MIAVVDPAPSVVDDPDHVFVHGVTDGTRVSIYFTVDELSINDAYQTTLDVTPNVPFVYDAGVHSGFALQVIFAVGEQDDFTETTSVTLNYGVNLRRLPGFSSVENRFGFVQP